MKNRNTDEEQEYIPWHRVWSKNSDEKEQMELVMTDIFMSFGVTSKNQAILKKFAADWGFKYEFSEDNFYSLSDQMDDKIKQDAQLLHEIRQRINYIYPSEFKWTDDLDDETVKKTRQNNSTLHENVAIADNKFRDYSEYINSISKSSKMFGLYKKLAFLYFGELSENMSYPKIEIL